MIKDLHIIYLPRGSQSACGWIKMVDPVYKRLIGEISIIPKLTDSAFYYPDLYQLYQKISVHFNVEMESIFSAGSDGVIRSVFERFVSPGDKVLYVNQLLQCIRYIVRFIGLKHVRLIILHLSKAQS